MVYIDCTNIWWNRIEFLKSSDKCYVIFLSVHQFLNYLTSGSLYIFGDNWTHIIKSVTNKNVILIDVILRRTKIIFTAFLLMFLKWMH